MKSKITRKFLYSGLSVLAAAIIGLLVFVFLPTSKPTIKYDNKLPIADAAAFYAAGPIFKGHSYVENLTFNQTTRVSEIKILEATYARVNQGNLEISISDASGAIKEATTVDTASLKDNSYLDWKLKSLNFSAGQSISISLTSNAPAANKGIAVYVTKKVGSLTSSTTFAGKTIQGSAIMTFLG